MNIYQANSTVGEMVMHRPALSRVFEKVGIDYCCGGKKTLEDACREKGLDPKTLLLTLEATASSVDGAAVDAATMSLTDLADHIEQTHHAYLRSEFPRLNELTEKVASVHGEKEARLFQVRDTYLMLAEELSTHMMKEERILFPMIRQLDASETASGFHCGSIANPIGQMEAEHDQAGSALEKLRELTGDFTAPDWACNTYLAMLDAMVNLEADLHQHIHKENNVLFPRAIEMERLKADR